MGLMFLWAVTVCVHSTVSWWWPYTFNDDLGPLSNPSIFPAVTYSLYAIFALRFVEYCCNYMQGDCCCFSFVIGACLLWACSAADWSVCSLQLCFSQTRRKAWVDGFKLPSRWIDSTMGPPETWRRNMGEMRLKLSLILTLFCGFNTPCLTNSRLA